MFITGTFNRWAERIRMEFNGNRWVIDLRLPVGTFQYKFVVDGHWRHDMDKPTRRDPIGNTNNFVEVAVTMPDDSGPYTSDTPVPERGLMVDPNKPPQFQPRQLLNTPLNSQMKDSGRIHRDTNVISQGETMDMADPDSFDVGECDPCLLPLPQHVVLTHLYQTKALHTHQYGISVRYRNKFVTTIVYHPSDATFVERERLDVESAIIPAGSTHSEFYMDAIMERVREYGPAECLA